MNPCDERARDILHAVQVLLASLALEPSKSRLGPLAFSAAGYELQSEHVRDAALRIITNTEAFSVLLTGVR